MSLVRLPHEASIGGDVWSPACWGPGLRRGTSQVSSNMRRPVSQGVRAACHTGGALLREIESRDHRMIHLIRRMSYCSFTGCFLSRKAVITGIATSPCQHCVVALGIARRPHHCMLVSFGVIVTVKSQAFPCAFAVLWQPHRGVRKIRREREKDWLATRQSNAA